MQKEIEHQLFAKKILKIILEEIESRYDNAVIEYEKNGTEIGKVHWESAYITYDIVRTIIQDEIDKIPDY